jgi:small subunit ribosomal protein S17
MEMERNSRKVRQGIVFSSAMDKTITVVVENRKRHPMYNKIMTTSSKLKAHDETNEAGEGDLVEIMETRPLSKTKRWRLVRIVEKKK